MPFLGEIMGVFRLWILVLCKVSHVKACFVHCNKARQKLLSLIGQKYQIHDSERRMIFCDIILKYTRTKCVFFSLLWKMLCAIPRETSGFRAISISLTRRSIRKEFQSHTVSTVEDVLDPPSCCLSPTSVLTYIFVVSAVSTGKILNNTLK
jgi:hypothetical protein